MTIPDPEDKSVLADLYGDVESEEFEAARHERIKHLLFELDMADEAPGMSRPRQEVLNDWNRELGLP